ncbi:hypothetical protein VTP01DRAFT_964 [Rhizomucor pusillus]|uniref:uncharacterized protein n=1 Tax=Rhizomucor pusillus TaxID=4840 RepID=UPI0037420A44
MPGSKEPSKHQINHYLEPLVGELLKLYTGINISIDAGTSAVRVRAALLMVACNILAARKVSGFTGIGFFAHVTNAGHFPSAPDNPLKRDFSGFRAEDLQTWIPRTMEDNKWHAEAWGNACTYEERSILEREHGTRWPQLHRLPYFDPVRCTVIDPMHSLYSGTAKRAMNLWRVLIDSEESTGLPKNGGADARDDSSAKLRFAKEVSRDRMFKADLGRLAHLGPCCIATIAEGETIQDFGPVYAFWIFSFGRFNGLVKNIDTNNKDGLEITFTNKLLENYHVADTFRQVYRQLQLRSSFMNVLTTLIPSLKTISTILAEPNSDGLCMTCTGWEALPAAYASLKMSNHVQPSREHYDCFVEYYDGFYDDLCRQDAYVDDGRTMVINLEYPRNIRGAYIQAYLDVDPSTGEQIDRVILRPGLVQYYCAHMLRLPRADGEGVEEYQHFFAFVRGMTPANRRA